jgi:hypothetical protein
MLRYQIVQLYKEIFVLHFLAGGRGPAVLAPLDNPVRDSWLKVIRKVEIQAKTHYHLSSKRYLSGSPLGDFYHTAARRGSRPRNVSDSQT